MKVKQLTLFEHETRKVPVRKYEDLSIHEKINVKANSQGFAGIYLNKIGQMTHIIRRDDHPERLTDKWYSFHKINKNRNHLCQSSLVLI